MSSFDDLEQLQKIQRPTLYLCQSDVKLAVRSCSRGVHEWQGSEPKGDLQHEAPVLGVHKVVRGVTLEIVDAECMQARRQRHAAVLVHEYMASYAGPRHNQSMMHIMVLQHAVAVSTVVAADFGDAGAS